MSKTVQPKTADTAETKQAENIEPPKSVFREYFESFAVTLVMAFFGMTFIVQSVTVPTGSMQNTIVVDDYLLVNKFIFAPGPPLPFLPTRDIRRGDIVVFKYPGNQFDPAADRREGYVPYQLNYVKRVIGLPGDKVEFRNNQVFVNDQLLPEKRVIGEPNAPAGSDPQKVPLAVTEFENAPPDATYTVYYREQTLTAAQQGLSVSENRDFNFGVAGKPSVVPENSYFMMGDSRDNSADSRVWGFVPRDLVIGRPMFIYFSCDQSGGAGFVQCLTHPRFSRIGTLVK
jgi:signal peptidase I